MQREAIIRITLTDNGKPVRQVMVDQVKSFDRCSEFLQKAEEVMHALSEHLCKWARTTFNLIFEISGRCSKENVNCHVHTLTVEQLWALAKAQASAASLHHHRNAPLHMR